jgi:hypothetical protein
MSGILTLIRSGCPPSRGTGDEFDPLNFDAIGAPVGLSEVVVHPNAKPDLAEDGIDVLPLNHFAGLPAADKVFPYSKVERLPQIARKSFILCPLFY